MTAFNNDIILERIISLASLDETATLIMIVELYNYNDVCNNPDGQVFLNILPRVSVDTTECKCFRSGFNY